MIKKRIIKNTLVNSGGKLLSFCIQLLIITYLVRYLGKEVYGVVVLALALAANVELMEAGFGVATAKYIADLRARGEHSKLLEIVNTNILVTTLLAAVFSCIILVINEFLLERIFTIPPTLLDDMKVLVRILIAVSMVEFWAISFVRVAEGFQRYFLLRVIEVVKWGLRLLFVVLALELGYGLGGIGMAYLGTGVLTLAVLYIFVFVRDPNLRINLRLSSRKSFRLLFGFSIWIFMAKIFAFISYRIDVILIGIFLAPVYLAYYSIAFKMYEALRLGLSIIPSALMPVAAELGAVADNRRLKQLFKKVSGYTVMFMYPLLLFTGFYADNLIGAWVGTGFEVSTVLAQLFVASLFLHALASSGAEMMVGLGRVKELALYSGIASVVNLAVSILLIKAIGVYGVVIGTLIGTCILVAGRLYMLLPSFKVSFYEFSSDILLRQVAGSAVLAFVFYLGSGLLYVGALALAVYIIFTIAFMMDKDDKRELMKVLDLGGRTL